MPAGFELPRCDVLGFPCFVGGLDAAAEAIVDRAGSRHGGYACLGNAHVLVTALHDDRLRRALDELVVGGVETTIPLFQKLVREPDIINGEYSIHWLEKYLAGLGH